jgi:cytochrome c-type biogenesis protein CcmH
MFKKTLIVLLTLLALFAAARGVSAQGGTPPPAAAVTDDQVNAVARKMYCPVCENIPLDVCPTQACIQWRATIREKLAAGWGEQQILDYFVQQYGERVLAQPSTRGLNILVWVIPPLALLGGVLFFWRFLRRLLRPAPAAAAAAAPAPADRYAEQLEKELEKRR